MRSRNLFVQFTKIDEEKREVAGRLTQDIRDRDNEFWDYESSVPHMKAWSQGFEDATGGKSVGNLRAMHHAISAGKLTSIDFNDAEKAVDIVAKIVDDAEWEKTKEGVYTGFSLGGNIVRSWRDPKNPLFKRFEVDPVEASLVDLPCVPTAMFSYVKAGGVVETRRFKKVAEPVTQEYADAEGKKFPLFTKTFVRASLALWGQPQMRAPYDERTQDAIGRKIRTAAKAAGIDAVTEKALLRGDFSKGLYDVGRLADLVQSLAWLQQSAKYERDAEDDGSTVPDQLCDAVAGLLDTLESMIGEEGDELLRMLGHANTLTNKEAVIMSDADKSGKVVGQAEWAKLAAKHIEKLTGIHTAMKAAHAVLGDACEKIAGFKDDVGGESSAKIATGEVEKVAKADFEKVLGERNEFEKRLTEASEELATAISERDAFKKTAEELAEAGETLLSATTVRKGHLRAIDRAADQVTDEPKVEPTTQKLAAVTPDGEVNRPAVHQAFKAAFKKPRFDTGFAEQSA